MKIKALFLVVFLFFPCLAWPEDGADSGQAAYCFDGDTFKLRDRRIVRLAGIDAPEVAHKENNAQFYSRESKKALIDLIKGKQVSFEYPGIKNRDHYGRFIAEALLPDGRSVNELMVEQGAAFFYPHKDLGPDIQERLRALQAEAIEERRGLWKGLLSHPVAQNQFIGNRSSMRFFPEDCPEAQRIKPRNRVVFDNLMDAFLAGYAPARICIFWPEEQGR